MDISFTFLKRIIKRTKFYIAAATNNNGFIAVLIKI